MWSQLKAVQQLNLSWLHYTRHFPHTLAKKLKAIRASETISIEAEDFSSSEFLRYLL